MAVGRARPAVVTGRKPWRTTAWLFGHELAPFELAGIALILVAAFVQLFLVRRAIALLQTVGPAFLPLLLVAALIAACAFARFRSTELPGVARAFIRGLALFAIAYAVLEPFDFPLRELGTPGAANYLVAGRIAAIACGLVALARPSFLLPALLYGAVNRASMVATTHIAISNTDFANVLEAGLFASSIGFSVPVALAIARRVQGGTDHSWPAIGAMLVVAASIGGHLGSYFHSGLAKLRLDGGPLSWMLDNQTQQGILIALEKGTYPFAAWPWLTQASYDLVASHPAIGNVLVVVVQLLAPIALLRRRLLIAFTLVYDLFHLGVYLIYGLLFWKWILLNLVIVGAFARSRERFRPAFILTGTAMTFFGQYFVWTAHLAWYNSSNLVSPHVEAVTASGSTVRVPSAAFGSLSYPFSHGVMFIPLDRAGHFPFVRWGSYGNYQATLTSRSCTIPTNYSPPWRNPGSLPNLGRVVRARHRQLLDRLDQSGHYNFYLYLHHHYPSPFAHQAFGQLDLRTVVRYRWVVDFGLPVAGRRKAAAPGDQAKRLRPRTGRGAVRSGKGLARRSLRRRRVVDAPGLEPGTR